MAEPDAPVISVTAFDVPPGHEEEFVALIRQLHEVIRRRGYGSDQLLQDPRIPNRYYDIRRWTGRQAVGDCHADQAVDAAWRRLTHALQLTLTHLVDAAGTAPDRRAATDRRAGFERRQKNLGRLEGDRRRGERRVSQQRTGWSDPTQRLLVSARAARELALAGFSRFKVGAALETADGVIISGCNVENATYGLTMCAERVALFKALSEGHRSFARIVVVADTTDPTPPCGSCRQLLWEFGGDLEIVVANLRQELGRYRLSELLPVPFDGRLLGNR